VREREGGREGGGDFVESITRLSFRAGNKSEIIKRSENNRNQSLLAGLAVFKPTRVFSYFLRCFFYHMNKNKHSPNSTTFYFYL
jgi:hypothetical protein